MALMVRLPTELPKSEATNHVVFGETSTLSGLDNKRVIPIAVRNLSNDRNSMPTVEPAAGAERIRH